jgi:thiosulfate dehydrogenase
LRILWVLALLGCASDPGVVTTTAVERGEKHASDPGFAESKFNAFACTTCHARDGGGMLPGAPLAGAARRPTFWGGRFTTLSDAVNECATKFMRAEPLDPRAKKWIDLWAYLDSIGERGPRDPWPFETVYRIVDLPRGNEAAGKTVWDGACRRCHGEPKTGAGTLGTASIVPNDTIEEHGKEGADVVRQVVIEKVRHGSYLGFPGVMPPFSKQVLSDQQVADVLTYLGLHDLK